MLIPGTVAAALAGLLFGLSLIVAIGAQNTYVIRQGIARAHVPTVVTICAVSDVILIAAGVAGLGAVVGHARGLLLTVRLLGVAFLLGYAALAARRALRPGPGTADGAAATSTWRAVAAACLAFTWLNPAVYLDTVVLLGSVAATRPESLVVRRRRRRGQHRLVRRPRLRGPAARPGLPSAPRLAGPGCVRRGGDDSDRGPGARRSVAELQGPCDGTAGLPPSPSRIAAGVHPGLPDLGGGVADQGGVV